MTVCLEAIGLGKRYRHRTWGLRHCSIRVPVGRITALVGPNGAGKTTLLQLAVGLLRPTEGSVRVLGCAPEEDPSQVLARVGFVAQDTPLYRGYSVADTLRLGRHLNRRWDEASAIARLSRLGIPMERRVGKLSGGQRAEVALTLALAKRPELLLLDEPLASLDPLARRRFLQELLDGVAAYGLTLMLSSHLIGELERTCDYLVVLNGGHVQVQGEIEELLAVHWRLVGPRAWNEGHMERLDVIGAIHSDRQSSLWVRGEVDPLPQGWQATRLSLEELVLAYLASPNVGAELESARQAVGA